MSDSTLTGVELGFVEKLDEKWKLLSHFFPSKVGGRPAWLCINHIPSINEIKCGKCEKPCVFLVQVYAPFVEKKSCFHRTIFLFICLDPQCSLANDNRNIIALRSQLSRNNEYYSSDPPNELSFDFQSDFPKADKYQPLCRVCGINGPKKCAKCKQANYCSKEHQTFDWKSEHKQSCSNPDSESSNVGGASPKTLLFPEYDLVTESEHYSECDSPEKSDAETMAEYKQYMATHQNKVLPNSKDNNEDLENMATGDVDKWFSKFKKRIDNEPKQAFRYERNGEPLWVSAEKQPSADDIPKCSCGSDRKFEFQVMPQLLSHLEVDTVGASIDWGTMAVYTCVESCISTAGYCKEFVWKQDFSATSLHTGKTPV